MSMYIERDLRSCAFYKSEIPCTLLGFQETEIKGYPKIYVLLVNAITGALIKAEWDSVQMCTDNRVDYYARCMERERMRYMMNPKIANILIQAGYGRMGSVYKLLEDDEEKLIKMHGIGESSLRIIKDACQIWKEKYDPEFKPVY